MSGNKLVKTGITLIAGLVATIAAPAITAQAATGPTTGQWSLLISYETAGQYACRIPDSTGNTINTYVENAPTWMTMGVSVHDPSGSLVGEWSSAMSTDPTPSGNVYLPRAKDYELRAWISTFGDEGGTVRRYIDIATDLARC